MNCTDATTTEYVVFDNGEKVKVEQVISSPDSEYTFVVIRDENGNPKSLLLENVIITVTEWEKQK